MNGLMTGVYIGIVEDNTLNDNAEIKIKIPDVMGETILEARIATLLAGDQYGCLFLPEISDLVLVAFAKGCGDYPVIIGSIWSTKNQPPDTNSNGKNDLKVIKTRSGNEIRITDTSGNEKIEIFSTNGNITLQAQNTNSEITLQAQKITLEGDVFITGTLEVGPDSGPKTKIDGNTITGQ